MSLVSVVIPVYNTEKYLKRCLKSVLLQTLKNIQIVCVNDGSQDKSLDILNEYAKNDERFVIIDLKFNRGVSYARNIAIHSSKSPYVFFLDSDDTIEPNCLEILYNAITHNNVEFVFGAYNNCIDQTIIGNQLQDIQNLNQCKQTNLNFINSYGLLVTIGGKMYKKDFLIKNSIFFKENFVTSEDFLFNFESLSYGAKFKAIDKIVYNYFSFMENSATSLISLYNSEIEALIYFIEAGFFDKLSSFYKIIYINNYIELSILWYSIYKSKKLKKQIQKGYNYLLKHVSSDILYNCKNLKQFKNIAKTFWQNVFSLESWIKLIKRRLFKSNSI